MATKNVTTSSYGDCYSIMDQALKTKGIRVQFPDAKRATVFRHRCYKGRAVLYRLSERTTPAGVLPSTPYDDIYIRIEAEAKAGGSDSVLLFELRSKRPLPAITDLEGNPIEKDEMPDFSDLKIEGITLD
ncbi:MAG: hypothetical protein HC888_05270 [Candidatus Competibacteraceae bacterium]|nr:hypothetical protein [Candidatus Competibacteraceae bacterium]